MSLKNWFVIGKVCSLQTQWNTWNIKTDWKLNCKHQISSLELKLTRSNIIVSKGHLNRQENF